MQIIMAVQYARVGAKSQKQADFDQAYLDWEIESAVIGTKLQAYFPDTAIPDEWAGFSAIVTDFYALEGVDPDERAGFAALITKKLGAPADPEHQDPDDWLALKNKILERKSALIRQILQARISLLS